MTWPFLDEFPFGSSPDPSTNTLQPEGNLALSWTVDPAASCLDYRCWLECLLDAGMVLHKPLPSSDPDPDTLASAFIQDANLDAQNPALGGVNLKPGVRVQDVIQRMATSTYTFVVRGWGLRVGYQIPIPGLKSVGGVTAVPAAVQQAYNVIVGNLPGGIPLWFATWELHYYVVGLPAKATAAPVPFNPALHIRPDAQLPDTIRLPWTMPDQRHALGALQPVQPPQGGITTRPQ